MKANSLALDIIQKSAVDVLNCKVADLFPGNQRSELKEALAGVAKNQAESKISFYTNFNHHSTRTIVTPIIYENNQSGWVVTLDDAEFARE